MNKIKTKRIDDDPEKKDGTRVLVDRIWPQGIKKNKAGIDIWVRNIAPSLDLVSWYSYEPRKWREFKLSYFKELKDKEKSLEIRKLKKLFRQKNITLLYSTREKKMNQAEALKQYIEKG